MNEVTIYHNPACGNSRGALELIRARGIEPVIIEYLKHPPDEATLHALLRRMGIDARELVRSKEKLFQELGLDDPAVGDAELVAQMARNPVLMNRPIVVTDKGARLCRPPERVLDLLPDGGPPAAA